MREIPAEITPWLAKKEAASSNASLISAPSEKPEMENEK
jgi:hypothetical protein